MIRVGKSTTDSKGKRIIPSYPGYTNIVVLTKSSAYGDLGPYVLKDNQGRIAENIWQFSKIYEKVPYSRQTYSRFDQTIIWNWPEDTHIVDGKITDSYWRWRDAGIRCKYPVRYPVGYSKVRGTCIGSLLDGETNLEKALNYIEARKNIYGPVYCSLVKEQPEFHKLKNRVENGENLMIIEVDVAFEEGMDYYKEKYGVDDNFIVNSTMEVNKRNFNIVLNDTKYPCGHGYFLAAALLDRDEEWIK